MDQYNKRTEDVDWYEDDPESTTDTIDEDELLYEDDEIYYEEYEYAKDATDEDELMYEEEEQFYEEDELYYEDSELLKDEYEVYDEYVQSDPQEIETDIDYGEPYTDEYEPSEYTDTEPAAPKNRKVLKILLATFFATILIVILASALFLYIWFDKRLHINTIVNGFVVDNMTAEECYELIANRINGYSLEIIDKNGNSTYFTKDDVGLFIPRDRVEAAVTDIISNQRIADLFIEKNYEIDNIGIVDTDLLKSCMEKSEVFTPKKIIPPQDAYIEFNEEQKKFVIVPDVLGNILSENCTNIIKNKIVYYEPVINLLDEGLYTLPDIVKENETLLRNLDVFNEYIPGDYTIDLGGVSETLAASEYYKWLLPNFAGEDGAGINFAKEMNYDEPFTVDEEKLDSFVDYLYENYNTFGSTRDFTTTSGREIKLTQGDYGWWLNYKETMAIINDALLNKDSSTPITAVYWQRAAARGATDYGRSYVEIDLSNQRLWLYVNGELILSSEVVTGKPSTGHATPPGIYAMTYKERNATLRGENYATPVSYWMPFNRDVGLHDATWQPTFGGSRYITNGSHGCVNLPFDVAKNIFSYVEREFPVILYH